MIGRVHIPVRGAKADRYASREDFRKIFDEDSNGLYQLSFLLTGNPEKAQRCFVSGFEDCVTGNPVFREWAHCWAKRTLIQNAIAELKPRPTRSNSPLSATIFPNIDQLSRGPGGHFEIDAVLGLEDFERFVFVISILEHYSEQDCTLFLGCSVQQVREARARALQQMPRNGHSVPFIELRQSLPSKVAAISPYAEQLVYTASETIPDLERQIQQHENALSFLLGENPQSIPRGRALTEQTVPQNVPAGIPSELLERRPDVRQAEQNMVAANAQIGVAKASFFPSLALTGVGGLESNTLQRFISQPSETWYGAFNVSQPVFQGGALRSQLRLARANWQEALLSYQQTFRTRSNRFPTRSSPAKKTVNSGSNRSCSRRRRSRPTNCRMCFIRTAARVTSRC
jgi:hypothetical protein